MDKSPSLGFLPPADPTLYARYVRCKSNNSTYCIRVMPRDRNRTLGPNSAAAIYHELRPSLRHDFSVFGNIAYTITVSSPTDARFIRDRPTLLSVPIMSILLSGPLEDTELHPRKPSAQTDGSTTTEDLIQTSQCGTSSADLFDIAHCSTQTPELPAHSEESTSTEDLLILTHCCNSSDDPMDVANQGNSTDLPVSTDNDTMTSDVPLPHSCNLLSSPLPATPMYTSSTDSSDDNPSVLASSFQIQPSPVPKQFLPLCSSHAAVESETCLMPFCRRCYRHGHKTSLCRSTRRCVSCPKGPHGCRPCPLSSPDASPCCVNCAGRHRADSLHCPARLVYAQIGQLRLSTGMSLTAARQSILPRGRSYRQALLLLSSTAPRASDIPSRRQRSADAPSSLVSSSTGIRTCPPSSDLTDMSTEFSPLRPRSLPSARSLLPRIHHLLSDLCTLLSPKTLCPLETLV